MSETFQGLIARRRTLERELAQAEAQYEQSRKSLQEAVAEADKEFGTHDLKALQQIADEANAEVEKWETEVNTLLEGLESNALRD